MSTPAVPARRLSESTLRHGALVVFSVSIALSIAAVALNAGLDGRPGLSPTNSGLDTGLIASGLVVALVGLLLSWARPRNSVGWLLALSGLFGAACNFGQTYGTRAVVVPHEGLPLGTTALALSAPLWIPALLIPATVLLGRYPSGHLSGRWARRFDRAFIIGLTGLVVAYASSGHAVNDNVTGHTNPLHMPAGLTAAIAGCSGVLAAVGLVGIVVGTIVRMVRAGYPERQQLAWLFTTAVVAIVVVMFTPVALLGTAAYATIPIAIAVGVMRYRLLGIQVIVRRTLVYGALTGLVLAAFVAVTAGLNAVVPHGRAPQLVAAIVVAVGLVPVRDRLQRGVDRFVYGDRRDPWSALQRLGTPMGAASGDVVPAVLAAVAAALRSPGAAVLAPGPEAHMSDPLASYGDIDRAQVRVPLQFGGTNLGTLVVAPRPGEDNLGKADERLLDTVAPLVAAVVHAELLAADLRAERSRVVTATEAERSRLRQELHDGLGPSLTGVGLGLEALESRTDADTRSAEMLSRLRAEVAAALEEIRRIIDDLRPAVFDAVDLVTALRRRTAQITTSGALTVDFVAAEPIPALAPEYETAIYRIADEAMTNVVRHAGASRCDVSLKVDSAVHLLVADNGHGLNGGTAHRNGCERRGVGLVSMRQRAERLGGTFRLEQRTPGTAVVVEIPVVAST